MATDGGDGAAYDHADWGNARVRCAGAVHEMAADPPAVEHSLRPVVWTSLTNAAVFSGGALKAWCDSCGAEATSAGTLMAGSSGTLRFIAGDGSHRYVGLSSRSGYHVTDFDFAFRAWGTTLNAYQDGDWVAGVSFVSSDVLSIAVSASGAVTFRKNGETIVPIVPLKPAPDGLRVKAALVDAWGSVEHVAADF